jgi:hypothetical protein
MRKQFKKLLQMVKDILLTVRVVKKTAPVDAGTVQLTLL